MSQRVKEIEKVKKAIKKRNFTQSFELIISLRDIDVKKKGFSLNETVHLPHKFTSKSEICIFASGDLAFRAKNASISVLEPEELDKLSASKRELRKIVRKYDFFLAEASLMPKIGKIFGPYMGPSGKMPLPLPPNAPLENLVKRYSSSVRVKTKNQLSVTCKVGDEKMNSEQIEENMSSILSAIEKKLPMGGKNIKNLRIKSTMGEVQKFSKLD
jgi:large subunit ribosomal protein L1